MKQMIEETQIVVAVNNADLDTDQTGDYVSMENYRRCLIIFANATGTAGDDWNFTVRQAQDVSGTGVKDLDAVDEYWLKQAATDLTGVAQFTRTTQTADALISGDATSAEEAGLLCVEIEASDLDVANGFDCLGCTVTLDASGGAQYGTVIYVLYDPRYPQADSLGAIAD